MGKTERIIIFTGKGGVGKTSVAAAHAQLSAKQGKKTLLVSTDMAHNLSDIFEVPFGKEPVQIEEWLDALEIDPNYEMKQNFGSIIGLFGQMLPKDKESLFDEEAIVFPGSEELFSLLKILELYEKGLYDVILVDCAPTGETLSLLKFPELLSWYMEKLFPIGKIALKVLRPISKGLFQIELPDKKAMNDIEKMYVKLIKLQELLRNREITSIRLVSIPEKMVVEETKRSYMYLNLYNYNVDGIIINRVLPKQIENKFFDEWFQLQEQYMEEIEQTFGQIPIQKVKWYDTEMSGRKALCQMVEDTFEHDNQLEVRVSRKNETYERVNDGYILHVYLPGIEKESISLHQCKQEMCIKVGNMKRNIPLPTTLSGLEVEKATYQSDTLSITLIEGIDDLKEGFRG